MKSAKNLVLSDHAREHLVWWQKHHPKVASKIARFLEEVQATPFTGTGKPEPLKHHLSACWSRRIDREHRLVYRVEEDAVVILSCRYHYE